MLSLARADWLSRDRILAWSGVMLVTQVGLVAFVAAWDHGLIVPLKGPAPADFVSFYAAGRQVLAGAPAQAYVPGAHHAAEIAATGPGLPYIYFYYPPVYLLWCAPAALAPLQTAFVACQVVAMAAWLAAMRGILRMPGWSWALPMLAFPAVWWTALTGQNAFILAALLGAATLLLDKRPILAGVLLGTMCFKPHLALLAPIALAAGGRWRAFGAAALAVALWVGLSVALFGLDIWRDYLGALAGSSRVYQTGLVDLNDYVTAYGAARLLGAAPVAAQVIQAAVSLTAAAAVAWIWRRERGPAVRSAALAAGTLLAAPLALMYDLMLLSVAFAWLVWLGQRTGFRPWEKLAMFFCFVVALVSRYVGLAHVPLGPLAPAVLLAVCLARSIKGATADGRGLGMADAGAAARA